MKHAVSFFDTSRRFRAWAGPWRRGNRLEPHHARRIDGAAGGITTPGARPAAIVAASVFDAVNGIERHYTPIHVAPAAPPGASNRAAAVQAAYASLVRLFPAKPPPSTSSVRSRSSRSRAVRRPRTVNRSNEGSNGARPSRMPSGSGEATTASRTCSRRSRAAWPPVSGDLRPRPTRSVSRRKWTMTPWAIASPSQFRPVGPKPLTSTHYAADLNETETTGSVTSATRTADETLYVQFWNSTNPPDFWDPVATRLSAVRHLTLSDNARLLARSISLWPIPSSDAGMRSTPFDSWRPITAIQLADTDGNPATTADPNGRRSS